jgi:RND family efflux transporter MFP subunit
MMIRCLLTVAMAVVALPVLAFPPLDCVIRPKSVIELGADEEGMISAILVERGDLVEAGDPVVRLKDDIQLLQVELTALRAASDADLRSQQTRLELRLHELERVERLRQRRVVAETVLDDATIEVALTELAVENALIDRQLSAIEHELAKARLARRTVESPVTGVVMAVEAAAGEFAHEQLTILRIAEIDPLYVEVFAPAEIFGRIQRGQKYEIRPMPPLEGSYRATVTVVDQIFDVASGTFGVRLELPNPVGAVPAGVRCTMILDASG